MPSRRLWVLLAAALFLRLLTLGWDTGLVSPHPDERQVAFVSEQLEGWFSDPGFYAYGSLHFQLVRCAARLGWGADSYRELVLGGRALSLVASLATILLGWTVARRVWGRRAGQLFLLLMVLVPLDLQQSHFATVEAHHAMWVMAVLAACCWLTWRPTTAAAVAVGCAWGASLAVKVASLPLVLPIVVAVILTGRGRGVATAARLAAAVAAATVAAFWLGQPSAFVGGRPPVTVVLLLAAGAVSLDGVAAHRARWSRLWLAAAAATSAGAIAAVVASVWPGSAVGRALAGLAAPLSGSYLAGVGEQLAMVTGRSDLPYVRIYDPTLPVLYPLRELALWALGPALLVAVIVGVALALRRLGRRLWRRPVAPWSRSATVLAVTVAWLVPMAIRLATLEVKYLRYWQPLVVPAVLVTAWSFSAVPGLRRRRAALVTVAVTAVCGVAYLWALASPHPHRTAAEWLRPMLEAGHTVAFEHWDETLGLGVPGVEIVALPSYDLPDDRAKAERWCARLAEADWVVLTSHRVRRTVLANPERFPRTAHLYRLLLSGEAGFLPLSRAERSPRLFGVRLPVQGADESFVNYEFPRVVVLRRVAEVDPEALVDSVEGAIAQGARVSMARLESRAVDVLPAIAPSPSAGRQLWLVLVWTVVLGSLGAAAWVVLVPLLRSWPDGGLGVALVTGWILPAWLMWVGCRVGVWPAGEGTASWIVLGVLAAAAGIAWRRRRMLTSLWSERRPAMVTVVAVTAAVGALFLVVRAGNPAIHWGEKPMDLSFLNAFLHAANWPPGEPWMAGEQLHYYYFGEVLAAFPMLVAGTGAAVGYNLMAATLPALCAALLAALGLRLGHGERIWAAAGALPALTLLSGNLAWPWLLHLARDGRWFDLWWATSRVIPGFAIDEYPLWTAIFADLHAHFLAFPVLLAAAAWGWLAVTLKRPRWWVAAALCGICTAVTAAANPWDLLVLVVALGCVALVSGRAVAAVGRLAAAAVVSGLAATPFLLEAGAWLVAGVGGRGLFLTDEGFAPAWAILRHFGLFVLPLMVLALAVLRRRLMLALPVAAVGVALGLAMGSAAAALALAAAAVLGVAVAVEEDPVLQTMWVLAAAAMLLVAGCERFTLVDRMNTLFKVYNGLWVLLAVALGVQLLRRRGWHRRLLAAVWLPLQLIALVNLPLGVVQGWLQPRMASPRPSLDGEAFLATSDAETRFLADALRAMARPGDVVAEAAGDAYREYTRVCMHTGVATVIGWPWHLQQRGQASPRIGARTLALEALYRGSTDPGARRRMLDAYGVTWVVLASVERRTYEIGDDDPFAEVDGMVRIAAHDGAALYRVLPVSNSSW